MPFFLDNFSSLFKTASVAQTTLWTQNLWLVSKACISKRAESYQCADFELDILFLVHYHESELRYRGLICLLLWECRSFLTISHLWSKLCQSPGRLCGCKTYNLLARFASRSKSWAIAALILKLKLFYNGHHSFEAACYVYPFPWLLSQLSPSLFAVSIAIFKRRQLLNMKQK